MRKIPNTKPQPPQASPLAPLLKGAHHSRRKKLFVNLEPQKDGNLLVVWLRLPLDTNYPHEAEAKSKFVAPGASRLDVKYSVKVNFDALRQSLDDEIKKIYGDANNKILGNDELEVIEPRQLKQLLAPLASLGANAFSRLFVHEKNTLLRPDETHGDLIRATIASVFSRPQIISINTKFPDGRTSAPLFPWAFIYDDKEFNASCQSTLDPQRFWGFKHVIQEELECTNTVLDLPATPSILTAICSDADKPECHKNPKHPLFKHNGNITEARTVDELGQALANSTHDCFYFFGHAYQPDPPLQTKSRLELCGEHLTMDKLDRTYKAPRFTQNPVLAFLNGCRTAPLNLWDNESIAGFLCDRGHQKVCCVSTVASVPGSVAAIFGYHFWKLFLNRKLPLGDAVLKSRKVMLHRWNNPLGLLYSVFGSVDTRVQR